METEIGTALILREWDEAWSHSRHLETMRSQYLGFYFAALLGVTAFTAREVAGDALAKGGSVVAVPRPGRAGRAVLWHGTELVLLAGLVGFPLVLAACVVRAATVAPHSTPAILSCAGAFVASLALGASCRWALRPSARPNAQIPQDAGTRRPGGGESSGPGPILDGP